MSRAQRRIPPLQALGFASLVGAAVVLLVLHGANLVTWRHGPDRGWVASSETGPNEVAAVRPHGARAGLRVGDRIVAIGGQPYDSVDGLMRLLDLRVGAVNVYTVERSGATVEIPVPVEPLGWASLLRQYAPYFALGVVFVALGVLVFLMKPWHGPSWAFLIFASVGGVGLAYLRAFQHYRPEALDAVAPTCGFLTGAALLHLALVFPQRRHAFERHAALLVAPYAIALALAGYAVSQGHWIEATGFARASRYAALTLGAVVFLGSDVWTWIASRSATARLQAMTIATGVVLAIFVPLVDVLLTLSLDVHLFPNFLYTIALFAPFLPLAVGYAIVRHDLFEIDVIVRRAYGYLLSTGAILGLYGLAVAGLNLTIGPSEIARSPAFTVGFVLAVVFFMQPMHGRIQRFVDRAFYRQQVDYRRTLTDLTERIESLLEPRLLEETLVNGVVDAMFLENGLLLRLGEERELRATTTAGSARSDGASPVHLPVALEAPLLREGVPVFRHEIELAPRYESERAEMEACFDALSAQLMLPMRFQGAPRGVLSLGRKKSGKMFTREDVDLLRTLISEATIALENARLFDRLAESLKRVQMLESIKNNLANFVPRTVQNLIEESADGEDVFRKRERDLTVMFADMTGYTRLSSQLALDDVNAIVETYFGAFLEVIHDEGGDVNETAGDGLMVLFQSDEPETHARAAVRAALGIQRRARELNEERRAELPGAIPVGMHVGINSGVASVGATKIEAGSTSRWTYTASGPTTNLAARVSALGEAIAITDATRRRLGDEFALEEIGRRELKNVQEPVLVHRVVVEGEAEAPPERKTWAGRYVVYGNIREGEDACPCPGLLVRAFDKDLLHDDYLGEARTDAEGAYEIAFTEEFFTGLFAERPDIYLRIFDGEGRHELHATRDSIRWDATPVERIDVTLPGRPVREDV